MIFAAVFWYRFCFATLASPACKIFYFENTPTGTYRSVIPRLRKLQKKPLVLNFIYVATPFSPRLQGSIISVRSQSEAL